MKLSRLVSAALGLAFLFAGADVARTQVFLNTQSAAYSATNAQTIKVITGIATAPIVVTQYSLGASAAGTVQLEYGTGATCGTGTVVITGALTAGGADGQVQAGNGGGALFIVPAGNSVCIASTGTAAFAGHVSYLQY